MRCRRSEEASRPLVFITRSILAGVKVGINCRIKGASGLAVTWQKKGDQHADRHVSVCQYVAGVAKTQRGSR